MLAAGVTGVGNEYHPQSVQQAPGKRGERPPSYNMGKRTMDKKLQETQAALYIPKSVWFLGGALTFSFLYMYHAFFGAR